MASRLRDCVAFQRPVGRINAVERVDQFGMDAGIFRKKYKFSKPSVRKIIDLLQDDVDSILPTNICLSIEERVLLALRFYATGFPKVVGAIDGTQIDIKAPNMSPEQFINRHGKPAINVQAVCNHRGAFINLVARWPGSTHDSRILKESCLWRMLENGDMGEYVILGDSGYGYSRHIMTPYDNPVQESQIHYNNIHAKTRVRIECVFGMWKRRFGCLTKVLQVEPTYSCKIITACAVLWNLGLLLGDTKGYETDTITEPEVDVFANIQPTATGTMIRNEITVIMEKNGIEMAISPY